jgi:hypothetical protein
MKNAKRINIIFQMKRIVNESIYEENEKYCLQFDKNKKTEILKYNEKDNDYKKCEDFFQKIEFYKCSRCSKYGKCDFCELGEIIIPFKVFLN